MRSVGSEAASVAKKKSEPCPAHAVPSFNSLASNVASTADRKSAELDLAISISCRADFFSAPRAGPIRQINRQACLHIGPILYKASQRSRGGNHPFALASKGAGEAVMGQWHCSERKVPFDYAQAMLSTSLGITGLGTEIYKAETI